jgi:hypothetical protein
MYFMKTIFKFVLVVVCLSVFSCKKDEVTQSASSSITSNGELSGVIVNDSTRLIDSIKVMNHDGSMIGKCAVPSTGAFTILLGVPTLEKYGKAPAGVVCSDTTAMTGEFIVNSSKLGKLTGNLTKCNFNPDSTFTKPGMSTATFVYSDRAFTVNGAENRVDSYNGFTITSTSTYSNVKFNKGWNEVVMTYNSYVMTTSGVTIKITLSNTIPADLKWKCSYIKTNGVPSLPVGKLARTFLK